MQSVWDICRTDSVNTIYFSCNHIRSYRPSRFQFGIHQAIFSCRGNFLFLSFYQPVNCIQCVNCQIVQVFKSNFLFTCTIGTINYSAYVSHRIFRFFLRRMLLKNHIFVGLFDKCESDIRFSIYDIN